MWHLERKKENYLGKLKYSIRLHFLNNKIHQITYLWVLKFAGFIPPQKCVPNEYTFNSL